MRLLQKRSGGFYLCFVFLLTLAVSGSAIVYADSGTAIVTIKAGSLTESNATNLVSLQLNKKVQLASYSLPLVVTDARGSGNGWNLSITSTRFTITKDKNNKMDQLPTNASRIIGISTSCDANSTCTKPTNNISYPLGVPAGNTPPPSVKFFNAAAKTGLGKFLLFMMVNVNIPANTEAGTYTTTVIVAIANGP